MTNYYQCSLSGEITVLISDRSSNGKRSLMVIKYKTLITAAKHRTRPVDCERRGGLGADLLPSTGRLSGQ
jgi:hypothetical protein